MRRPNRKPNYIDLTTLRPDAIHMDDNEKIYFGTGDDYYIYFDGTNFLIDSGTHSLEIDLATAGKTSIYGGDATGDGLFLYANSVDATTRIELEGGGDIKMAGDEIKLIASGGIVMYSSGKISISGALDMSLAPAVNQDVFLNPTGSGRVKFGTHVGTGDVVSNGHILIQDAGGTERKVMITA